MFVIFLHKCEIKELKKIYPKNLENAYLTVKNK